MKYLFYLSLIVCSSCKVAQRENGILSQKMHVTPAVASLWQDVFFTGKPTTWTSDSLQLEIQWEWDLKHTQIRPLQLELMNITTGATDSITWTSFWAATDEHPEAGLMYLMGSDHPDSVLIQLRDAFYDAYSYKALNGLPFNQKQITREEEFCSEIFDKMSAKFGPAQVFDNIFFTDSSDFNTLMLAVLEPSTDPEVMGVYIPYILPFSPVLKAPWPANENWVDFRFYGISMRNTPEQPVVFVKASDMTVLLAKKATKEKVRKAGNRFISRILQKP